MQKLKLPILVAFITAGVLLLGGIGLAVLPEWGASQDATAPTPKILPTAVAVINSMAATQVAATPVQTRALPIVEAVSNHPDNISLVAGQTTPITIPVTTLTTNADAMLEPLVAVTASPLPLTAPARTVPTTALPPRVPTVEVVSDAPPAQAIPNQVILTFDADVTRQQQAAYIAQIGGQVKQTIEELNVVVISVPETITNQQLAASSLIASTEPDYQVSAQQWTNQPNDPLFTSQWSLTAIGAPQHWLTLPFPSLRTYMIAVIDSGVCAGHPDLQGRLMTGYDFVENDQVPQDAYGHGCAVTGIIAAQTNNGAGMAGLAPNVMILPMRVLDNTGNGSYSSVAAGIVGAADAGAQIINLSLGGSYPSTTLENAVNYAVSRGVTLVAAAGNGGSSGALYPAAYGSVIGVGSVDADLLRSSFSNYGTGVDIYAPGRDLYSTDISGGYAVFSGTSFASPVVAAALVLEAEVGRGLNSSGGVLQLSNANYVASSQAAGVYTAPVQGAVVSGNVMLAATVSGGSGGIQYVGFTAFYGGSWHSIAADTSTPYGLSWDMCAAGVPNGNVTLALDILDNAGNYAPSSGPTILKTGSCGDTTPPSASYVSPINGTGWAQSVPLGVNATDSDSGVQRVQFTGYWGGSWRVIADDTSPPYSLNWNMCAAAVPNGIVYLAAGVYDNAGNYTPTAGPTITKTVGCGDTTPPSIRYTTPTYGTVVTRTTSLTIDATDVGSGVQSVRFTGYWGGSWRVIGTDTNAPYTLAWDLCAAGVPGGVVSLGAEAYDNAGNLANAPIIAIFLAGSCDSTAPTGNFTAPANGATVPQAVVLRVNASDVGSGVQSVRFTGYWSGSWRLIASDNTAPYEYGLDLCANNVPDGVLYVAAEIYDNAGNLTNIPMLTLNKALGSCGSSEAQQMLNLVNQARCSASRAPLSLNTTTMYQAALRHSNDMAYNMNSYIDHVGTDGSTMTSRLVAAGYTSYSSLAENIAAGYSSVQAVFTAWMNSDGHRANILSPNLREMSLALVTRSGSTYGTYWTQDFGTRSASPVISCAMLGLSAAAAPELGPSTEAGLLVEPLLEITPTATVETTVMPTGTVAVTAVPTMTETPAVMVSATEMPISTVEASQIAVPTMTETPTAVPTATETATPTATTTQTPTAVPTATETATPTATTTETPTAVPTATETATPTATETPTTLPDTGEAAQETPA